MYSLFFFLFIIELIDNSILLEKTVEENDQLLSTSEQQKMIQSSVQVSQNVSVDFMQGQLSQDSHAFQTKTDVLVVEQGDHIEKSGLDEDTERKELYYLPKLGSIYTDDLPDLEDIESTMTFSTNQCS